MLTPAHQPTVKLAPFRGAPTTLATMIEHVKGVRGERSLKVRMLTESVVRRLTPKDYLSEILAVRNFVAEKCRYLNDPVSTEWVKDPERIADEIAEHGTSPCDCDEIAQMIATMARQCGRDAEFVTVGFGAPGSYTHVFARVLEPRSRKWVVCDPVAGTDEAAMLRRVQTFKIWRID